MREYNEILLERGESPKRTYYECIVVKEWPKEIS